jgi:hypothetical protein
MLELFCPAAFASVEKLGFDLEGEWLSRERSRSRYEESER